MSPHLGHLTVQTTANWTIDIMNPQSSVFLPCLGPCYLTTQTATPAIIAPTNEVCSLSSPSSPLPSPLQFSQPSSFTNTHLPSIPILPPPQYLHGRSQHRHRRQLPLEITADSFRAADGQAFGHRVLVPQSLLLGAWVWELYQDGREVFAADGDRADWVEDAECEFSISSFLLRGI